MCAEELHIKQHQNVHKRLEKHENIPFIALYFHWQVTIEGLVHMLCVYYHASGCPSVSSPLYHTLVQRLIICSGLILYVELTQ